MVLGTMGHKGMARRTMSDNGWRVGLNRSTLLEGCLVEDTLCRTNRIPTMVLPFAHRLENSPARATRPGAGTGLPRAFGLVSSSKSFPTPRHDTRVFRGTQVGGWWVNGLSLGSGQTNRPGNHGQRMALVIYCLLLPKLSEASANNSTG